MIYYDISPAVHQRAGIGRMAGQLFRALQNTSWNEKLTPFYNRSNEIPLTVQSGWSSNPQALSWGDKRWRAAVMIATYLRRSQDKLFPNASLFHATDHLLPYLPSCQTVFTLHDLTPFSHQETHSSLNRLYSRLMWPYFLRHASFITCDSESTLKALHARFPDISPQKTAVVYLGVESRFRPVTQASELERVRKIYKLPARFLLFVGTIEPRKNVPALLSAYHQARLTDVNLVVAGKRGWRDSEVDAVVERLSLGDSVSFPGFIADEDLPTLYSLAEAFIFPSLYEGFGFPVLEAMACGTPVVCSRISSLPELAGEGAIWIDPHSVESIREGLIKVTSPHHDRTSQIELGLLQARRFTWDNTAREMGEIYQQLLNHS